MPRSTPLLALFALLACATAQAQPVSGACTEMHPGPACYPPARTVGVTDTFHGVQVADPYRWMEDLHDPSLESWLQAQNTLAANVLDAAAHVAAASTRLARLQGLYPESEPMAGVTGPPRAPATRRYFRQVQQDRIVLMAQDAVGPPRPLLADTELPGSVRAFEVSPDGRHVAIVTGPAGADWGEVRIVDSARGAVLPAVLPHVRFQGPIAWSADGSGLLYQRFAPPQDGRREAPAEAPAIYLHTVGQPVSADRLLYALPSEFADWSLFFNLPADRRRLFMYVERGPWHDGNLGGARARMEMLEIRPDGSPGPGATPRVLTDADAAYRVLHVAEGRALVFTDRDAPRRRVVSIPLQRPGLDQWRDVVPQGKGVVTRAEWYGGRLVVHAIENVRSVVRSFDLAGAPLADIALPGTGVVQDMLGDPESPRVALLYSGLLQAPAVLRHDLDAGTTEAEASGRSPDLSAYEARQEWFTSKDGTRVPMFIVARRNAPRDGRHPVLLHGYGASGTALLPGFREDAVAWLQMGGVYALANVRGGSEFGNAWYRAATRERKQASFDDFIAAAEHLVATGWTVPRRLAISGASNGGLLVTASMVQRPDLFAAVLADVPVTDAMRRHLSGNGMQAVEQWGTPADAEVFPALRAYSPLHNVRAGTCYPATLITTARDDERLPPWHAYKLAAALQAAQACAAPVLLRIADSGGHGGGVGYGRLRVAALQLGFAASQLGMPAP